jgi:DNA-binding beta-propeller fold protein YncE/cytochrome c553
VPATARTTATNGSAVVLTRDDAITVATNRTANTISIFSNTLGGATPAATRTAVIPAAATEAEPWAAVIGNDDNTAYVILRRTQELVRVSSLRSVPTITARINVGSEPTGLAISPMGGHVYVANWADGTVSDVNVTGATMTVARTINLNPALGGAGSLGPTVTGTTTRPGLAHPRAIVITNDNDTDESDETVYVTEFFAQRVQAGVTGLPSDISRTDIDHRGLVYHFSVGTPTVNTITLPRFTATGFGASGCFPTQLYAAALKGPRLFVTSLCESPRGPVAAQENLFAAIMVVNTTTQQPEAANHVLLTRQFQDRYEATATAVPDTAARRFPLIPNDIAFLPTSSVAYVSSYGSDAIFRVQFAADGSLAGVGNSPSQHFIDLGGAAAPAGPGRLPIGIAVANTTAGRAVALNENTRNLSLIDLGTQVAAAVVASADPPAAGRATNDNLGRRFFVTGLGRWSRNGQGWGSCEGCHPDGLTDNVTWSFAAGPRQTTSLDGTFDRSGDHQRILNWTGIFDEVHDFEGNTRGASGGVGALVHRNNDGATPPVVSNADRIINDGSAVTAPQLATATPQAGLSGSTRSITAGTPGTAPVRSTLEDWEQIDLYVRTIRPPRAPSTLVADDVTAGRTLFTNNCAGCHGSPAGSNLWTIARRFYEPNEARNNPVTGTLRTTTYTGFPTAFAALNQPSANGVGAIPGTAPFRILTATIMAQGAGGGDQISCILRSVGTIGGTTMAPTAVVPAGVPVFEVRANGTAAAMGVTGFNPPALVGMGSGAPFFHGGNARTLEEMLDNVFRSHHQAMAANFLDPTDTNRARDVRQLVAFLLSIDDDTMPVALPANIPGVGNPDLCRTFTP